jgi:hypothetical protein
MSFSLSVEHAEGGLHRSGSIVMGPSHRTASMRLLKFLSANFKKLLPKCSHPKVLHPQPWDHYCDLCGKSWLRLSFSNFPEPYTPFKTDVRTRNKGMLHHMNGAEHEQALWLYARIEL